MAVKGKVSGNTSRIDPGPVTLEDATAKLQRLLPDVIDLFRRAVDSTTTAYIANSVEQLSVNLMKRHRQNNLAEQTAGSPNPVDQTNVSEPGRPLRKRRRIVETVESDAAPTVTELDLVTEEGSPTEPRSTPMFAPTAQPPPIVVPHSPRRGASVDSTVRGKRRSTRRRSSNTTPPDSSFAISRDCGPKEISRIRAEFQADLLKIDTIIKRDGREEAARFSQQQAEDLTQYFFDEVMGPQTLQRLIDLGNAYTPMDNHDGDDAFDAGSAARMKRLAHDKNAPMVIRRFLGAFTHHLEAQVRHPLLVHLQQVIQSRDLLVHYERVRGRIESGDVEIIAFLEAQGLRATVGRGWASVTIDFLAEKAGVNRRAFVNTCERAKGINQLVDQFGVGVLPLLPPGALSRLRRFGNQLMGPAYELLKRHVASMQPICDLVKTNIYEPFLAGDAKLHLDVASLSEPKSHTLIDIMTDATHADFATPAGGDGDAGNVSE